MLSEMHDPQTNRSTAGIRADIPDFLRSTEKVLEEYGRRVRALNGKGTKHHVKFDDGETTIYLNLRKSGDERWSRVYAEDARRWVQQMRREDAERVGKRFNRPTAAAGLEIGQNRTHKLPLPVFGQRETHPNAQRAEQSGREMQQKQQRKVSSWTGTAGSAQNDKM